MHEGAQSVDTMAEGRGSDVLLGAQNGIAHPVGLRVPVLVTTTCF